MSFALKVKLIWEVSEYTVYYTNKDRMLYRHVNLIPVISMLTIEVDVWHGF